MKQQYPFHARGSYIEGEFDNSSSSSSPFVSISPADGSDIIGEFGASTSQVDKAVDSSLKAFNSWKKTPIQERLRYLLRFKEVVQSRQEEFAHLIAREVGKPIWEARTEVNGVIGKVTISIDEGLQQVSDVEIHEILPNTEGSLRHRPLGVLAVLGPFNFPAHLPNGHIIPALLSGNTVVFKPSEKTPAVGQFLVECFSLAGLPPGVLNMIQGGLEVSKKLVCNEQIKGILFTGSYSAGKAIKSATLDQPWKLLALEMGGKNSAIVWDDADMDTALYETLTGAFLTSGQRCSATSKILVHHNLLDEFVSRFIKLSSNIKVGHPLDNVFMGPVIDSSAKIAIQKGVQEAIDAGFENLLPITEPKLAFEGNYLNPTVLFKNNLSKDEVTQSNYLQQEIFGPETVIIGVENLDDAIQIANATPYGLVGSVFTSSLEVFEQCWWELETGLVNLNKSTVGASSKLPFGGLKASGNHFPTALFAGRYCNAPITSMKVRQPSGRGPDLPGLSWDELE